MKNQKIFYIAFMILSVVMCSVIAVASFMDSEVQYSIFHSVWTVFLLAAFALICLICLFAMKFEMKLRKIGVLLFHSGIVVFLCGCFMFYIWGDTVTVSVPVDSDSMYNIIKREEPDANGNDLLELDFYMGITDFSVERYTAEDGAEGVDKHYEATLKIMPSGSRETEEITLTVNHPHKQDGWKIYLMNYDRMTESAVQLTLKNDPGEMLTYFGIWFMIAGAVIMCLPNKRRVGAKA